MVLRRYNKGKRRFGARLLQAKGCCVVSAGGVAIQVTRLLVLYEKNKVKSSHPEKDFSVFGGYFLGSCCEDQSEVSVPSVCNRYSKGIISDSICDRDENDSLRLYCIKLEKGRIATKQRIRS